jgi:hypothetical protein
MKQAGFRVGRGRINNVVRTGATLLPAEAGSAKINGKI